MDFTSNAENRYLKGGLKSFRLVWLLLTSIAAKRRTPRYAVYVAGPGPKAYADRLSADLKTFKECLRQQMPKDGQA